MQIVVFSAQTRSQTFPRRSLGRCRSHVHQEAIQGRFALGKKPASNVKDLGAKEATRGAPGLTTSSKKLRTEQRTSLLGAIGRYIEHRTSSLLRWPPSMSMSVGRRFRRQASKSQDSINAGG